VTHPRVTTIHGAEHIAALFFKDISKLAPIKYQIVGHPFMYRVFGSGAMRSPYALFQKHARSFNSGCAIGLLHASDTRTVGYFMAMHRDLRLKGALQATISGSDFISLKVKSFKDPTDTIQDKKECHRVFYLLQVTLPALMVLQLADGNKPAMDKLYYFVRRTTETLELAVEYLNDLHLFPRVMPPNRPFDILLEDELDDLLEHEAKKSDADDDDDTDDDDTNQFEGLPAMGDIVLNMWKARANILESDFATCGWYLCVF
jgi:hypothetical protein